MKKMMAMVLALLLAANLCSCAVLDNFGVKVEPMETPADVAELPKEPEEPKEPEQHGDGSFGPDSPAPEVPAHGNLPSNIAAGGHAVMSENGQLFWSMAQGLSWGVDMPEEDQYGIFARVGDGYEKISSDNAGDLNIVGNTLYYIAQTWNGEEGTSEIVSMNFDGTNRRVIGEALPMKWKSRLSDDDNHAEYTHFGGYSDMIAFGDKLYFIADNGKSGSKDIYSMYMDMTYSTIWHNEKSLYRMDLDGSNKEVVVERLGNGNAHFTIDISGTIYYSTCYDAGATVYPPFTLHSCDLDGKNDRLLYGTEDTADKNAPREIMNGMFFANGYLFISASDSEGDFPHGRLMAFKDGYYEFWGDETYYVNYAHGGGLWLYSLFTPTDHIIYDEDPYAEYIEDAKLIRTALRDFNAHDIKKGDVETLHEFGDIERWVEPFSHFELYTFGDETLVLLAQDGVYTYDAANGLVRIEK